MESGRQKLGASCGCCTLIVPYAMGIPQFTLTKACCLRFLDNHAGGWVRQHFCHRARPHSRFGAFHRGRSRHLFLSPPSCRVGVSAATVRLTPDESCELNRSMQHHLISRSENTSPWSTALSGCTQSDPSQDGVPFESKLANDF